MAWYNSAWLYRQLVTIDNTKVDETVSNFPVLVSTSDATYLGAHAQADGDDILFTANDGTTKLDHELQAYSGGTIIAWVRLPSVSSSVDTTFYMYYGNLTAGPQENPTGVWDSNYKGVWHLTETSGVFADSTSNGNDGTASGSLTRGVTGKIGLACDFSGGHISMGAPASLNITGGNLSIEAWYEPDVITGALRAIANKGDQYALRTATAGDGRFYFLDGAVYPVVWTNGAVVIDTFVHLVGRNNATALRILRDGVEQTKTDTGTIATVSTDFEIGRHSQVTTRLADGVIDEVRVSNIARSNGWYSTQHNNHNSPGTFLSYGSEEAVGWIGTINGVASVAAVNSVAVANIAKINTV